MIAGMLMKIVYVGRCDSLASKLVDRMAKEENDIYIISSASSHIMYSFVAFEKEKFLAAEKSSIQGNSYMLSVNFLAIDMVSSVEPVSTITISSTRSETHLRHLSITWDSFFTIIQRLMLLIQISPHLNYLM